MKNTILTGVLVFWIVIAAMTILEDEGIIFKETSKIIYEQEIGFEVWNNGCSSIYSESEFESIGPFVCDSVKVKYRIITKNKTK